MVSECVNKGPRSEAILNRKSQNVLYNRNDILRYVLAQANKFKILIAEKLLVLNIWKYYIDQHYYVGINDNIHIVYEYKIFEFSTYKNYLDIKFNLIAIWLKE